jgi:hypothetical protein
MYVFSTAGEAVGFVFGSVIYDLEGTPLGRLLGSRVHRVDGSYAGEWFHSMVVDRRKASPSAISPIAVPPGRDPVDPCAPRRPAAEFRRYPDAFSRLYEAEPLAAE